MGTRLWLVFRFMFSLHAIMMMIVLFIGRILPNEITWEETLFAL
ncbi:hypothetical protein SSUST1_1785 [Streptococcus suis ST1]|nr:hypothetical protein SSUST1_1785 [Streptococcus suis ST1]